VKKYWSTVAKVIVKISGLLTRDTWLSFPQHALCCFVPLVVAT